MVSDLPEFGQLLARMCKVARTGENRLWFQIVITNRYPLTTEQLDTTYPLIELSELDLRRAHLDEKDIARLTPVHRQIISQTMRLHYIHDFFWPELRQVANVFLDNLDNP